MHRESPRPLSSSPCIQQYVNLKPASHISRRVRSRQLGQIAKDGSDILEVMRVYHGQITHVHLKDWSTYERGADGKEIDSTDYANYKPVSHGALPTREVLDISLEGNFGGWINAELDGTQQA